MAMQSGNPTSQAIGESKRLSRPRFYRIKRGLIAGLALIVALLIAGYRYEQSELERIAQDVKPTGRIVDIGGRGLHLHIEGEGSPTVILNAGAAGSSLDWARVTPRVSEFTRVVAFDRAGLAWSDPSSLPPNANNVVDDLRTALRKEGIEGPFLLVGHSLGGLHCRMYYYTHPDEVAGLILVDPRHESEERYPADDVTRIQKSAKMFNVAASLSRVGATRIIMRARGVGAMPEHSEMLPESVQSMLLDLGPRHSQILAAIEEFKTAQDTDRQVRESMGPMRDLPLTVLAAAKPSFGLSESFAAVSQELCSELATSSSVGQYRLVEGSAHYIHVEQPDIVVEEIQRMVNDIRALSVQAREP